MVINMRIYSSEKNDPVNLNVSYKSINDDTPKEQAQISMLSKVHPGNIQ